MDPSDPSSPPTDSVAPEDRRFQAVFGQAAVGVAVVDTDSGSFRSANARFCEIAGLTNADLQCTLAQDLIHPDDRDREARQAQALRDGQLRSYTHEIRYLRADGSVAWVNASVSAMWAAGEAPTQHLFLVEDITERKRAEDALRASEARYRMLWETTTDAVIVLNGEGLIQYANPAVRQVFGHDPDELLGRSMSVLQPEAARAAHTHGFHRYLKTGVRTLDWRRTEVVGLRADGSEVPLEISFSHADIDGAPMLAGFLRDISARKAAEASLAEWKNRYEATIHASGQLLYDWNTATNVVSYGGDVERLTGYTSAELGSGLSCWMERVHEDDLPAFQSAIARVIAQQVPFHLEYRLRRKDGEVITLQDDGHFVRDAEGQAIRMVGFVGDISARKSADDALRISEERLKLAVSAGRLGTWDWTVEDDRYDWSPLSRAMFGFAPDEDITFDKFMAQLHPDDRELTSRAVRSALKEQTEYEVELRILWPDGSVHWIEALGRALFDEQGRARRMTGVVLDITERKRAEHQRLLLESHVRESQKMEAIGTLAGGIAHDFNNILAAILGNVAMAQDDIGGSHQAFESLSQVRKAAMRARTLVQQILTFSRREPQALRVQPVLPLVAESLALLRSTLPAGVSLTSTLSELPLQIAADGTQIEQVIMNLCTNAWHAVSGEEGACIEVGLAPTTLAAGAVARLPPGHYAHLWVGDNGCGMDQATQSRIFEPFFTTKQVGQGTGLGLAIVHGIVLAHGGAVVVDSQPGQGSRFHVYLPLHQGQPSAAARPATAMDAQSRGQGQRVLYVDDDDVMVLMVGRLLERIGYRVTCLQDSAQALALLREQPRAYDVLVSDFNMPGLSGLDLAREARHLHPGAPVIISSGGVSPDLRRLAAEQGVAAVLEKQNTLEELAALLHAVLSGGPAAPPPA